MNSAQLDFDPNFTIQHPPPGAPEIPWTDKRLARVEAIGLYSEKGTSFHEVMFAYGLLKSGERCHVKLPFSQLQKGRINIEIIKAALADGVYAKGLNLFAAIRVVR